MAKRPERVKARETIRREIRQLRRLIDDPATDQVEKRIAYELECVMRWATERVVGWPKPVELVPRAAKLIRQELQQARR